MQNPNADKRERVRSLDSFAHKVIRTDRKVLSRGKAIQAFGFGAHDALHLACAEAARADFFLTTDDRLVRIAKRKEKELYVHVANPLNWLEEMTK